MTITPTNRELSQQAIAEAEQVLRDAGFTTDAEGRWPSGAVDALPEATTATRYWVTYADDGLSFSLDAIDWWNDWSMHRHVSGVDVPEEDWI